MVIIIDISSDYRQIINLKVIKTLKKTIMTRLWKIWENSICLFSHNHNAYDKRSLNILSIWQKKQCLFKISNLTRCRFEFFKKLHKSDVSIQTFSWCGHYWWHVSLGPGTIRSGPNLVSTSRIGTKTINFKTCRWRF